VEEDIMKRSLGPHARCIGDIPDEAPIALRVVGVCCACLVLLFIALGVYAFPIADDHTYGMSSFDCKTLADIYRNSSGRYVSSALLLIFTGFSDNLPVYHALASLHIAMLLAALRALVAACHEGEGAWLLTLCLAAAFLAGFPSPSQGLYWLSGSFTYFPAFNAMFGVAAALCGLAFSPATWDRLRAALLFLCIIVCMGCDEITAAACAFMLCIAWGWAVFSRHPCSRTFGRAAVCGLLLMLASFLAPGNFVRAADIGVWDWSYCINILGGAFEGYKWIFAKPVIPCMAFCVLFLRPRWGGGPRAGFPSARGCS
jgi:hypothetical protein